MTSTILVTGGTGTLGRRVVPLLRAAGYHVRVLSRHGAPSATTPDDDPHPDLEWVIGDLARDIGLDAAVAGADTILHLGGSAKRDEVKTANLVRAVIRAASQDRALSSAGTGAAESPGSGLVSSSPRLVYISVVGADRVPVSSAVDRAMFGYYAAKLESERLVATSGLPWTTLRATQFYDSLFALFDGMAKSPVLPVFRGVRFQPVDTGEVAERLVELVAAPGAGLVPDLAGPRAYEMVELVRSFLRAVGRRRLVVNLPLTGGAARAVQAGAILSLESPDGRRSWEDFLADRTSGNPTGR